MAQALITIDATAGSNPPNGTALVVGSTVSLNNTNSGGELTYLWEWLDKPEGSLSAFSNAAIQNPTFVIDSEGTYLIKLTVNRTLATEQVDTVIAAVKQMKSLIRIPAAGETQEESTSRGWAEDVNRGMRTLDANQANPAKIVAYANGSLSTGKVVYFDAMQTIKSTLPGEEKVPRLALAQASSTLVREQPLFVVHSKVGGGTSVSSGQLCYVTLSGIVGPLALGAGAILDPIYVDDTGAISTTVGTNARRIGHIVYVDSADYYVYVDGSSTHTRSEITLIGNAGINKVGTAPLVINVADDIQMYGDAITIDSLAGTTVALSGVDHWQFTASGTLEAQGAERFIRNVKDPALAQDAATKAYADGVSGTAMFWGNQDTPATSTEVVLDPGFCNRTAIAAASTHPEVLCPFAGTVEKLYVLFGSAADANIDCTVFVNGSTTGITCQVASAGVSASDTTHTAAITAGQKICVHFKAAGGISVAPTEVTASVFIRRS